jgi:hypothetical protein
MRTLFRVALTINSAVAAFYFVFWMGGAIVAGPTRLSRFTVLRVLAAGQFIPVALGLLLGEIWPSIFTVVALSNRPSDG